MEQLDAVNLALRQLGVRKVTSLNVGLSQVSRALDTVNDVTLEVQKDDWDWNLEEWFPLAQNSDGTISVPTGVLKITSSDKCVEAQVRGGKLYDVINHTFTFDPTRTYKFDITWQLQWDDIPFPAQWYIAVKAARKFATLELGDPKIGSLTEVDEVNALTSLRDYNFTIAKRTAFDHPDMHWVFPQSI